jgi:AraC-like DNA-binding protein
LLYRKDIILLPKEFAFDFFETEGSRLTDKPMLHFHDCLELNYIEEGNGINYIENNRYTLVPNDFYVINNLEHHMAVSAGFLKMKVIVFDPKLIWNNNPFDYEYLKPFYSRNILFSNRIASEDPLAPEILYLFKKIEREWLNRLEGYKMVIKGLLTELLAIFYRYFKTNNSFGEDTLSFHKSYDRLRDVLDYINNEPESDFTLDKLSGIALMNKTYFASYFKKVMNVTVFEFIENVRISYACMLLRTTGSNITDIAFQCGFNSVTHFNRIFKKHLLVAPVHFRNKNQNLR